MKYRAKMTFCIPQIENIYNTREHLVVRDATDFYIEVDSPDEADLIEKINNHYRQAFMHYGQLLKYREK